MIQFARRYIHIVDTVNRRLGRVMMYSIFVMVGILLWSSISKTFFRMDLFYSGWTTRKKAQVDAITVLFLIFYLGVMLYGGWDSLSYSLKYGERSPTAWRPYLWPIKLTMCIGLFLMLLQAISELIKDIATIKGVKL